MIADPTPRLPKLPWQEGVEPAPEDVARWMKGMSFDDLVLVIARQQATWGQESRCFVENHPGTIESLRAQLTWLREQIDSPRVVHVPDNLDVDELKKRVEDQLIWPGKVTILSEPRPRPVPYLVVPAVGTCGSEPPCEWRDGVLREVYPDAAGVSQCAREPHDPAQPHIGVVWLPTGPDAEFTGREVMFP